MLFAILTIFTHLISWNTAAGAVVVEHDQNMFPQIDPTSNEKLLKEDKDFWYDVASDHLDKILELEKQPKKHVAKNVVILIGDGMGIPTVTATRIYKGQRIFGKSGEDHKLVYEQFPNVGLVKTYNVDMQVPDSAGTGTALFTGVKTRYGAIGVDFSVNESVPNSEIFEKSKVETIMDWAQHANKDTGIITTTRITHATPAATYAHVLSRAWECNSRIPKTFRPFVKDIARQLIEDAPGNKFKVILGGGYQELGHDMKIPVNCLRTDGLNLTECWIKKHKDMNASFVTNNQELANVSDDVDYLLGLFYPGDLPFELLRDKGPKGTPSLYEMTKKGLQVLKKSKNGYVLMVEGGRIDHGHHLNYARIALEESAEFDRTVGLVVEETGPDTLIIVTSDHSHTMSLNGYSKRGNDILGYGDAPGDKHPLTLTYANGPGFFYHYSPKSSSFMNPWIDVKSDPNRLNNPEYRHLAAVARGAETHGGEDVGIFATGPGSHLVRGVMEQNCVAHLISYAACIGPRANMNPHCNSSDDAEAVNRKSLDSKAEAISDAVDTSGAKNWNLKEIVSILSLLAVFVNLY